MDVEEFAKKYLGLELKPYQIEWLKRTFDEKKPLILAPRMKGMSYDLIIKDDVQEALE